MSAKPTTGITMLCFTQRYVFRINCITVCSQMKSGQSKNTLSVFAHHFFYDGIK